MFAYAEFERPSHLYDRQPPSGWVDPIYQRAAMMGLAVAKADFWVIETMPGFAVVERLRGDVVEVEDGVIFL
jgi:hypothetical protein